eukprot:gene1867-3622_t
MESIPLTGKRKRISRLMMVDGFQVFKSNNYNLEDGEPSVWDAELGDNQEHEEDDDQSFLRTEQKYSKPLPKKVHKSTTERHVDPMRAVQMANNLQIKEDKAKGLLRKQNFIRANWKLLCPFLDQRCPDAIIDSDITRSFESLTSQPSCIKNVEMRDYQLAGVNWLIKAYESSINVILGDEMGLGKTLQTIAFLAETVRKLHYEHVLLLTGTPLQNNLHELWSLLNFLQPDVFHSSKKFDECFNIQYSHKYHINRELLLKVHSMLKPFMLRRIKADVEKSVPPKIEKKILCPLTPFQIFWYKRFLLKENSLLKQFENDHISIIKDMDTIDTSTTNDSTDNSTSTSLITETEATTTTSTSTKNKHQRWKRLQSLVMQLRKVCNHPYLFEEADPNPEYTNENIILSCGKLHILDRLLIKLKENNHRVVIFSQFTSVLDILCDYLSYRDIEYYRLDGSTNRVQRQVYINSFNAKGSMVSVFVMTTRAGGLGVNLQTADTVILYDSDWNPQADLQAMARVHRIGQQKVVHVYRLVAGGTVEERIVQRAEKKLYLDQMVNRDGLKEAISAGEVDIEVEVADSMPGADVDVEGDIGGMGMNDLLETLRFGADVICHSTGTALTDADIDRKGKSEKHDDDVSGSKFLEGQKYSVLDFNPVDVPVPTRVFDGQSYDKYNNNTSSTSGSGVVTNKNTRSFYNCSNSMKNIDVEVQHEELGLEMNSKRQVKNRLLTLKDDYGMSHQILKNNMYDLNSGETSVFDHEYKNDVEFKNNAKLSKKKVQLAGRDFENEDQCLVCWEGGDLLCCDRCPLSFHALCININIKKLPKGLWSCPHHSCMVCNRSTTACGGLTFRCSECPNSYCEDHLPELAVINGRNMRIEKTGFIHPKQATSKSKTSTTTSTTTITPIITTTISLTTL